MVDAPCASQIRDVSENGRPSAAAPQERRKSSLRNATILDGRYKMTAAKRQVRADRLLARR